jgi:hypothetical protein
MNYGLIFALVICLAIFVGSIEQARIIMRRQTPPPKPSFEAQRNTLRGEVAALVLGINQVQGYINKLKGEQSEAIVKACTEAQSILGKASAIKQEVEVSLEKAESDTAVQICTLRLDQARFHVRIARNLVEKHIGQDNEGQNNEDQDADR